MPRVRIDISGLDYLERQLTLLSKEATTVAARAVYAGAGVAADALRGAVEGLQRVPDVVAMGVWRKGVPSTLSVSQKNGLREGLGIAPFKFLSSSVNTKVGFSGYNSVRTKRWPNGQPNQVIAAVVNHGNSNTMQRQPFITVTAESEASNIRVAMIKAATEKITEILES